MLQGLPNNLPFVWSRGGKYSEEDAKIIMVQILSVAAYCHLQGVVHRDLKPEVYPLVSPVMLFFASSTACIGYLGRKSRFHRLIKIFVIDKVFLHCLRIFSSSRKMSIPL